mmetsp:Transcript_2808/g.7870  ORF Transcript_2808/g.7870 Transcript_2808/m.7870 type:complete len:521 (-) Transcript_2808:161-1723(-)
MSPLDERTNIQQTMPVFRPLSSSRSNSFDNSVGSSSVLSESANGPSRGITTLRKTAARRAVVPQSPSSMDSSVSSTIVVVPSNKDKESDISLPLLDIPEQNATVTQPTWQYQLSQSWNRHAGKYTGISWDKLLFFAIIAAWFLVSVLAIVTTKILATTWQVPPLILTAQQLIVGSTFLRLGLDMTNTLQPWPTTKRTVVFTPDHHSKENNTDMAIVSNGVSSPDENHALVQSEPSYNREFILTGLFNMLDNLASNSAFHASAASFVETIKASEPITTSMVALLWQVDTLRPKEGVALFVLITGVLLSTYDNAESHDEDSSTEAANAVEAVEKESAYIAVRTALTIMTANICFAFRALCQKKYRANSELLQITDFNLLCRMQQIGAATLLLPSLLAHFTVLMDAILTQPTALQLEYIGLAVLNGTSFAIYNGASCYVLSNVSVLHHSGLNCLRRMFVTVLSCFVFGNVLGINGIAGIILCFAGFSAFTHSRAVRKLQPPTSSLSAPTSGSIANGAAKDTQV